MQDIIRIKLVFVLMPPVVHVPRDIMEQLKEQPQAIAMDKLLLDIMLTNLHLQRTLMVLVNAPWDIMEQLQEQPQAIATDSV